MIITSFFKADNGHLGGLGEKKAVSAKKSQVEQSKIIKTIIQIRVSQLFFFKLPP